MVVETSNERSSMLPKNKGLKKKVTVEVPIRVDIFVPNGITVGEALAMCAVDAIVNRISATRYRTQSIEYDVECVSHIQEDRMFILEVTNDERQL